LKLGTLSDHHVSDC